MNIIYSKFINHRFVSILSVFVGIIFLFHVVPFITNDLYASDTDQNLFSPPPAHANWIQDRLDDIKNLKSTYEFTTCIIDPDKGKKCDVNLTTWGISASTQIPTGVVANTICATGDHNRVLLGEAPCVDVSDPTVAKLYDQGIVAGGLGGLLAFGYQLAPTDIAAPTNLALFINDVSSDSVFGTPAYAETSFGPFNNNAFKRITLSAWKIMRNLALALLGVITAITAIMIIFRKKISAQAVITVYNILPRIPIAVVVILLSYPFVSLAISLVTPLSGFAVKLGIDVFKSAFSFPSTAEFLKYIVGASINSVFMSIVTMGAGNTAIMIIIVVVAVMLVITLAVGLVNMFKAYASMIGVLLSMPLVALLSIMPGQEKNLVNLFAKLAVDVLTIPAMIFIFILGLAMIVIPTNDFHYNLIPQFWFVDMFWVMLFKWGIGLVIMWQGVKIRGTLTQMFGATKILGGQQQRR